MRRPIVVLLLAMAMLVTTLCVADESGDSEATSSSYAMVGDSMMLYGGVFQGSGATPQLSAPNEQWLLGVAITGYLQHYPRWGGEFALLLIHRDYAVTIPPPLFGVINDDMSLFTNAFALGVRRYLPFNPAVHGYGVAGLAYYDSTMIASGSSFGFPGTIEESDSTMNLYAGLGIEGRSGTMRFSLDYRYMPFSGSFTNFNIHGAEIGGQLLFLGIGKGL